MLRYTMAPVQKGSSGPSVLVAWSRGASDQGPEGKRLCPNPEGVPEPELLAPTCAEGVPVSLNPYRL